MKKFSIRLFSLMLMVSSFSNAETVELKKELPKDRVTHYIHILLKVNPELGAAYHTWKAQQTREVSESALPDPQVGLGVFLNELETRVGPQKEKLSLTQKIPWKGKLRLKSDIAKENTLAAKERYNELKLKKIDEFKQNYYDLYYLNKSIGITQSHIHLLNEMEQVISSQYAAGRAPYNSILRVQVEIDTLKDRLATLKDLKNPLNASINALLNRNQDSEINMDDDLSGIVTQLRQPDDVMIKNLYQTKPLLRALRHDISKEKNRKRLASKNHYPDFSLGLDWINTGGAVNPSLTDSGKDPLVFRVGINIPLWKKKYRALDTEANERILSVTQKEVNVKNSLDAKLKKSFFDYRDSKRKMTLYSETIIPKATEALDVTFSSFETDTADYLDVIESEKILLDFELNYHKAVTDTLKSMSKIELLAGNTLIEFEEAENDQ